MGGWPAYTTVDLQIGYRKPGQWLAALDIFNLADAFDALIKERGYETGSESVRDILYGHL